MNIYYIYTFNSWNLDCHPWVSWMFLQNNNHQVVKNMKSIENRKNADKKTIEILYDSLRVVVSVCVCVCVSVCRCVACSSVLMCVCMSLS